MCEGNYIKINRKLLEWEWFSTPNTLSVWMFILLKANWKDGRLKGVDIPRGSFATSYDSISKSTGLTVKQVRTALNHLKRAGQVASQTYHDFSVITVLNYEQYQQDGKPMGEQRASRGQAEGKQRATIEEGNKERRKEGKKIYGQYSNVYLSIQEYDRLVSEYGETKTLKAISFLDEYIEEKGYKSKSHNLAIRRWVIKAIEEKEQRKTNTQFEGQRKYDFDALEKSLIGGG